MAAPFFMPGFAPDSPHPLSNPPLEGREYSPGGGTPLPGRVPPLEPVADAAQDDVGVTVVAGDEPVPGDAQGPVVGHPVAPGKGQDP
jgi:hypothetical protein